MAADPLQLFPGKVFISTALEALVTKTHMSGELRNRYLQRAAMAGFLIGLFYVTSYGVRVAFEQLPAAGAGSFAGVGAVAGALTFGWALVFIYYTKSELLTSNMMLVMVGAYYRRTGWRHALRLLTLCYLGNLVGGLVLAGLLRLSSLTDGAVMDLMVASVDHKLDYVASGPGGWGDLLVRAILCNFCINIAMLMVYNGLIKDDLTRSLVMIVAVFIFAFLGLEHSVANTVLFLVVGLAHGVHVGLAAGNVAIALVGNFIGGGLLIGTYYAYVNDDRKWHPRSANEGALPDTEA
ncbi:MAG: formate/nitrite transporter family protein [Actinomycetales bacterium]|nr:formate/nitrite transporter family protein [Actinomycetales bacterium]